MSKTDWEYTPGSDNWIFRPVSSRARQWAVDLDVGAPVGDGTYAIAPAAAGEILTTLLDESFTLDLDTRPAGAAIGARLRAERTRAGISQQRLGARLGVTFQQIQKYESGANRISLVTADVLATIFAVPVATFLALQQPRGHSSETSTQVEPGKETANAH